MSPTDDMTALEFGRAILGSLDFDQELTREELDVFAWRFAQLVEHGYEVEDALEIARAKHVDLEVARSLTATYGCPPELAVRILL
jgi:hypothetical protein